MIKIASSIIFICLVVFIGSSVMAEMPGPDPKFSVKLANTKEELHAAQRLRYRVFVDELGGDGPMVDHDAGLEIDRFDPFFDHLILMDDCKSGEVVGVYRLLRDDQAMLAGQFYSEDEYDLSALKTSGRRIMELGRSCLDPTYRGGAAMYHLWNGLAPQGSQQMGKRP